MGQKQGLDYAQAAVLVGEEDAQDYALGYSQPSLRDWFRYTR